MQKTDTNANGKLLRAAALDSLIAELGEDFSDFVTAGERSDMIEERVWRIRKSQKTLELAA